MAPTILVLALLLWRPIEGLIGFDCGGGNLNISTLSLLDIEDCHLPKNTLNVTETRIHLLQLSKYDHTLAQQCKIIVKRTVSHCGMHSHTSAVTNGQAEYLVEINPTECTQLHRTGRYNWDYNKHITGVLVNQTTTHSVTIAGTLGFDGSCKGVQYSDPYGTWENVVVYGTLSITLQTHSARIHLDNDQIHLHSGTTCKYSIGTCIDAEGGYTHWDIIPRDQCHFEHYKILYQGIAKRVADTQLDGQIIYSLETKDTTFALAKTGEEYICGYTLIKTEHPKLLIIETNHGRAFSVGTYLDTEDLDIFTYINSKFIYVEKHIKAQINQLYHDVITQRCNLEQQVLKNALTIATQAPDEFAYQFMKGPGYMAVIAGEVIHLIKCIPVEVSIRRTTECYQQLPVKMGNQSYFITPRTHILTKTGTQINCNTFIPPMYFLLDGWYKMLPGPVESKKPLTMKPMTNANWTYTNPASLATSGIYPSEDLDKLRDYIMFPVEKQAIVNTVARGVMGEPTVSQGASIANFLDEKTLENIVDSTWNKLWGGFITFGTASAGLIGIYFFGRLLKLMIDTIVHGYALHDAYGWSIHLLGAIWDSVTNLLLHLSRKRKLNDDHSPEAPAEPETNAPLPLPGGNAPITLGYFSEGNLYPVIQRPEESTSSKP